MCLTSLVDVCCVQVGQKVRAERAQHEVKLNPFTAGVYIAVMMATVQTLQEKGHPYSEICNEVREGWLGR